MKTLIKKTGIIIVTLLLALQMYGVPAYAAEGDISFTDPKAEVGEKVDVTVRVFSATTQLGSIKLNMEYNPQVLKFEQGTNAVDSDGKINLTADLGEGASDVTFVLTFTTLKEGTTKLTVSDYTATNVEGSNVELTAWDSTITIGEGGPVEEKPKEEKSQDNIEVTVDGENYTVNSTFSEKEIPVGFEISDGQIEGKTAKALYNKESGVYLYSLKNKSGETNFFLTSDSESTLKKTVVVDVSMDKYIMILDPDKNVSLPKKYQSTTMTLNGIEFSIWNNVEDQDYYLIYALNSEGKAGYYQYDAIEGTYQRCNDDLSVKTEKKSNGILSEVAQYTSNHILQVICIVFALFLICLITIILLAVKLAKKRTSREMYFEDDDFEDNRLRNNDSMEQVEYDDEYDDEYEESLYDEEEMSDYEMEFDDYYDEEEFEEDPIEKDDEDEFMIDFIEL